PSRMLTWPTLSPWAESRCGRYFRSADCRRCQSGATIFSSRLEHPLDCKGSTGGDQRSNPFPATKICLEYFTITWCPSLMAAELFMRGRFRHGGLSLIWFIGAREDEEFN